MSKLLTDAGSRVRHNRTGGEYEVMTTAEMKIGSGDWQPCVIYRPVMSGFELAEAAAEGKPTYFVRPIEDFNETRFTAIN